MSKVLLPPGYRSSLTLYETQEAIEIIKKSFQGYLKHALNLKRVSAPLFVDALSGLNDDLSGVERPVAFDILENGAMAQVVQSLAKWKRVALKNYGFPVGEGLYTDMNAIRRDEEMDNIHSIYVDQWDWEKVITDGERNLHTLKDAMQRIVTAICVTLDTLKWTYPALTTTLTRDITFITTQELEDLYPDLTPKEREHAITRKYGTVGLLQIGGVLRSGNRHDGRAPDYDDWSLNGDILFYNQLLDSSLEISSMGIRVSPEVLSRQLTLSGHEERRKLPFHQMLLSGELPFTMGGGIGQSRMCMLLLGKAHIGEVHASLWDEKTKLACQESGIMLL